MFNAFLDKYDKHYQNKTEYKRRFRIFRANMKKAQRLQETERGTAIYGATQFSDLTR
jgi:cathepsin F